MTILNLIFGIIFVIVGICMFGGALANFTGAFLVIILVVAVLFFVAGIQTIVKAANKLTYGADVLAQFSCIHLGGLPLGEVSCLANAFDKKIIFTSGKSRFELEYSKIVVADLREKSELAGASAGSIVAGAVLFGALGAVIASRPKNKREYIMAISYVSNGEDKSIALAVPYENGVEADKALNVIRRNITTAQNVVL